MTVAELEQMNEIEIEKADKSMLVDITTIKIDSSLSAAQRMENYLKQIKNPYCFLCDDTAVRVRFESESKDLTHKLKNYYINIKES